MHPGLFDQAVAVSSVLQWRKSGHDPFMRQHFMDMTAMAPAVLQCLLARFSSRTTTCPQALSITRDPIRMPCLR